MKKYYEQRADSGTKTMETGDHSKNGASPKSLMSRGNITVRYSFLLIFALAIMLIETSCGNNAIKDDSANTAEKINKAPGILDEDYNAWFQLDEKYIENFNLKIVKVKMNEYWDEDLVVALVENITDKQRGGFFNTNDMYIPLAALDEEIATLEEIATQMKNEVLKYNCIRRYITSYGIKITFHYSSDTSKWDEVNIYYDSDSDENVVILKQEYLMNYIRGLKDCRQYIVNFKEGKLSNR